VPAVKAFIFDADGPLYQRGSANKSQKIELLKKYGFTADYTRFDTAYNDEKFKAYVQTESAAVMFVNVFQTLGIKLDSEQSELFTKEFNTIQARVDPSPSALETLAWLHENRYKVCILTDSFFSAAEKWPWFKQLGMDAYIDEIISSFDIKRPKDTPEAYQVCLSRLGVSAHEAVFVGHQQYEMVGAKKVGITSICLKPIAIPANTVGDYTINSLTEIKSVLASVSS
jgi:HAD superfamily hydrolase (TIGR01509 family)